MLCRILRGDWPRLINSAGCGERAGADPGAMIDACRFLVKNKLTEHARNKPAVQTKHTETKCTDGFMQISADVETQ